MSRRPVPAAAAPVVLVALAACSPSQKPTLPDNVVARCSYTNRFSSMAECRTYVGTWSVEDAQADCGKTMNPTFEAGEACSDEDVLGWCLLATPGQEMKVAFPGTDTSKCGTVRTGCEVFAKGYFDPSALCGGVTDVDTGLPPFQQPVRVCRDPKAGEAPGRSENGQVCTWQIISGATEEGRRFSDYASCDAVRTQRPYYPAPEDARVNEPDPRMDDAAYVTELEWVRSQIRASACVCCHGENAPNGTSNWNVDRPGNFVNGWHDRGIAMGAGWIDTVGFGAYPAAENNGFGRPTPDDPHQSIVPTTDRDRMLRFFVAEAEHRGRTAESFTEKYGAGPLDDQRFFRPTACGEGEAIGADGTITWKYGKARYVYVLEADAPSPTVPPNLDLPAGTLWRLDVSDTGAPLASGTVRYGETAPGTAQKFPLEGAPAELVRGKQYYLYVLADIAQPVTRCLATVP